MVKIENGDIYYPSGDTFKFSVGRELPFDETDTLRLQITKAEAAKPFIDNIYKLNVFGEFDVVLAESDTNKLQINDRYMYRLTVVDVDGNIDTEKSGKIFVEWGVK